MPRVQWPLLYGHPIIEVILTLTQSGQPITRTLLADTGAGDAHSPLEVILQENDCLACGGRNFGQTMQLGGAYSGSYRTYMIRIAIPQLHFDQYLFAVAVASAPAGLDGIAGFRFLNRFAYGNFADPGKFGLEN